MAGKQVFTILTSCNTQKYNSQRYSDVMLRRFCDAASVIPKMESGGHGWGWKSAGSNTTRSPNAFEWIVPTKGWPAASEMVFKGII